MMPVSKYIYMDESGDLGELGSSFFVIACVSVSNPRILERIVKRVRERKLKKKMKDVHELKANSSKKEIREAVLRMLAVCDCSISAVILEKKKIRKPLYDAKNRLYNYIFGYLVRDMNITDKEIEIIVDKKDSNRLLRDDFNQYVKAKINEGKLPINISIVHMESHASAGLQVVDFVAWATNRKYAYKDSSYYDIIGSKVKVAKEMWD